tara:strand:- start:164 stop:400 length:237 start_codon:yes stop_codon:yes gene_type:complete
MKYSNKNVIIENGWVYKNMGEAKRRKEQGLPPRLIKKEKKPESSNILQKLRRNQILQVIVALGFVIFLIVDLVRYYNQ